jgi:pyrroline-5-carboxylate reductase
VSDDERRTVEAGAGADRRTLWVEREEDLDAVTALSGSGRPTSSTSSRR